MEFILAGKEHLSVLDEMAREFYLSFGIELPEAAYTPALHELLADRSRGFVYLIRSSESELAGYIVLTAGFSLELGGRFALIDELYVREAWRNRGIGSSAIDFAAKHCGEFGFKTLRLEVHRTNDRALALYKRLGFGDLDREFLTRFICDSSD